MSNSLACPGRNGLNRIKDEYYGQQQQIPGIANFPNRRRRPKWLARFSAKANRPNGHLILKGFYLRIFADKDNFKTPLNDPEISVDLRPEEWLDLAYAMKHEYECHDKARKGLKNDGHS
jgi:hypothetical protein